MFSSEFALDLLNYFYFLSIFREVESLIADHCLTFLRLPIEPSHGRANMVFESISTCILYQDHKTDGIIVVN